MPQITNARIAELLRKLAHEMPSDLMGNGFDEECDETRLRDEIEAAAVQLEATARLFTGEEVEKLLADNMISANGYRSLADRAAVLVRGAPVLTEELLEAKIRKASEYLATNRATTLSNFALARQMLDLVGVRG